MLLHLCTWLRLIYLQVITNLVKMVKARDIRRPFCPAGHWLSDEVNIRADKVFDNNHSCVNFWFLSFLDVMLHQIWAFFPYDMPVNKIPNNMELYFKKLWADCFGQWIQEIIEFFTL